MTTIIFSDTHLTDQFDQQLYDQLVAVIESADRVIINGDFWEGFLVTFDEFVTSPWKQLFPLLKAKQTIYLHGNHDEAWMCDSRTALFASESGYEYSFMDNSYTYHVQHGHRLYKSVFTQFSDMLPHVVAKTLYKWIEYFEENDFLIGQYSRFFRDQSDISGHQRLLQYFLAKSLSDKERFITGHTHTRYIPNTGPYLNPGRFTAQTPDYLKF